MQHGPPSTGGTRQFIASFVRLTATKSETAKSPNGTFEREERILDLVGKMAGLDDDDDIYDDEQDESKEENKVDHGETEHLKQETYGEFKDLADWYSDDAEITCRWQVEILQAILKAETSLLLCWEMDRRTRYV